MPAHTHTDAPSQPDRDNSVRGIIHEFLRRKAAGEKMSDQALLDAHPDLRVELDEALRGLRVAHLAVEEVDQSTSPESNDLRLRCPHCHTQLTMTDTMQLSSLACSSCGNAFTFAGDAFGEGTQLGHFELLEELGVGAFGTVWRARDKRLDRLVAIKIPHSRLIGAEDTERFIREAQTVARLSHPRIVKVHEIGTEGDRVYLVTDLVRGKTLADGMLESGRTWREAVKLCCALANTLDHAHKHGVVHRDLKPSNVMLDSRGEPCLMDFGLAKRDTTDVSVTVEGKLVGTPAYMSPEQARGAAHDADARSDIYSLGVMLFELLTGERPFRGTTQMLVQQTLLDDAPSPRRFNGAIPKDVETVCLKCLEKNPDRRYQTASELGQEFRRLLAGEPVQARPISVAARTWRWCLRNPLPASLAATILITVVVALWGITWALVQADNARQLAADEAEQLRRQRYFSDIAKAYAAWEENDVQLCASLLERHQARSGKGDLRRFEWYLLWELCKPALIAPRFKANLPASLAFTPEGKLVVAGMQRLHILNPANPEQRWTITSPHTFPVGGLALRPPDYRMIATASLDETLQLQTLDKNTSPQVLHQPQRASQSGYFYGVSFSSDGALLATNHPKKKSFLVWKITTLEANEFQVLGRDGTPQMVRDVAFSPSADSRELALACSDGVVRLWDVDTCRQRDLWEHDRDVFVLAFSPDGRQLATAGRYDRNIKVGDVATGEFKDLTGHPDRVMRLSFSPDGSMLASAGADSLIRIWDTEEASLLQTIKGHSGTVTAVAFSPDGKTLASVAWDGDICMWDLSADALPDRFPGSVAQFSSDGKFLLTSTDWDWRDTQIWDATTGGLVDVSLNDEDVPQAVSADMRLLAKALPDVDISMVASDAHRTLGGHIAQAEYLWFSPTSDVVASMADGELKVWEVATSKLLSRCELFQGADTSRSRFLFAIDDEGRTVAFLRNATPHVYKLEVRDVESDTLVGMHELDMVPTSLAFSPGGMFLATGYLDGTLHLRESQTGQLAVGPVHAHPNRVSAVAISPDGTRIASGGRNGAVKIWDLSTGEHILSLRGRGDTMIKSLTFSQDGTMLAAGGVDNSVRLLRAPKLHQ